MCMTDSRVSESNDVFMTYKVVQNDGMDVGFSFKQKNIQICNGFVTAGRSGSNRSKKDVSFWTAHNTQKWPGIPQTPLLAIASPPKQTTLTQEVCISVRLSHNTTTQTSGYLDENGDYDCYYNVMLCTVKIMLLPRIRLARLTPDQLRCAEEKTVSID